MQSSWLFLDIDEVLFRGWLFLSWLWAKVVYIVTFQWAWSRADASTEAVLERLVDFGLTSREAGNAYMSMAERGMSNLEMMQAINDLGRDGLSGDAFVRAVDAINPALYNIDASTYGDGFFRLFGSRPSHEVDSIQGYIHPVGDQSLLEVVWGILVGTGDRESIFSLLFGTIFGWIIIITILAWFVIKHLEREIGFMAEKHALTYDLAHTGYVQQQANNKSERWDRITRLVAEDDPNGWKLAIMDADILLDEVLSEQGYAGSTVGEKLQDARKEKKLETLEYAAEMHGIRNKVAHQGDYVLTQREAKSGVSMLEKFFNELYHL